MTIDPTNQHDADRPNIFLVEDDPDSRMVMTKLFESKKFSIEAFEDGESALAAILENPPAIAIIDIRLPGISGLEVAKQVRAIENLNATILIAMTGFAQQTDRDNITQAGFDAHLMKPTRFPRILETIDRLILERG